MTINYTTLLGLAQPVTGTETGQWGDVVNDEITSLLEDAVANAATFSVTSGNVTLTTTNGASNQARMSTLIITGTPGTTRNVIAPSQAKVYQVINQSDGAVVIKGAATTGVTIAAGATGTVVWNGTDFVEINSTSSGRIINGNLQVTGNLQVDGNTTLGNAAGDSLTINAGTTTLNQGTANGVAYLNGSKVLTTGSALTFDGSLLNTTGAIRAQNSLFVYGTGDRFNVFPQAAGSGVQLVATNNANNAYAPMLLDGSVQVFNVSGGELMRLTSSGLQIGTTTNRGVLTVNGATATQPSIGSATGSLFSMVSQSNYGLIGGVNAAGNVWMQAGRVDGTGTAYDLYLQANGGYVGIGTSTPTAKLHVTSTSADAAIVASNQVSTFQYFVSSGTTQAPFIGGNSNDLLFGTTGSARMRLDSAGSLGLAVVPSGWGGSAGVGLDVGSGGAGLYAGGLTRNAFFNGTNWIYKTTGPATFINTQGGGVSFNIAGSGSAGASISFTQAMTLTSGGFLALGTTAPNAILTTAPRQGAVPTNNSVLNGLSLFNDQENVTGDGVQIFFDHSYRTPGTQARGAFIRSTSISSFSTGVNLLFGTGLSDTLSTKMTLDAFGNLGLGVTPSAWSATRTLQLGARSAISALTGGNLDTLVSYNTYFDGSAFRYIASAPASFASQSGGLHYWFTAPSGTAGNAISFTQAMTLTSSAQLLLGTTGATYLGSTPFTFLSVKGSADNTIGATGGSYTVANKAQLYLSGGYGDGGTRSSGWFVRSQAVGGGGNVDNRLDFVSQQTNGGSEAVMASIDSSGKLTQNAGNYVAHSYNENAGSSYTITVPSIYGVFELSIYAYRIDGGNYGTRYQVYHIGSMDGYPYSAWAPATNLVSNMERSQTGVGPSISISAGVNGAITVTVSGTGSLGSAWALRELNKGPGY